MAKDKFTYGDIVEFMLLHDIKKTGCIEIIDANGTFFRPGVPSYDIYNAEEEMLYKHIPEECVIRKIRDDKPEEWL